jgi:cell division protein ZapA
MPVIKILNRDYKIACGEGQEQKLLDLAAKLDKRLHDNSRSFKGANEITLIILTALMLEDSIQEFEKTPIVGNLQNNDESNQIIDALSERIDLLSKKFAD